MNQLEKVLISVVALFSVVSWINSKIMLKKAKKYQEKTSELILQMAAEYNSRSYTSNDKLDYDYNDDDNGFQKGEH